MSPTPVDQSPRLLRRCTHDRMLGGVAAGVANYLDVDPTVTRLAFVVLGLLGGVAVPLYLAAWLLVPEEGEDRSVAEQFAEHRWPPQPQHFS